MKPLTLLLLVMWTAALNAGAREYDREGAIDPFLFLAGLAADGQYLRSIDPSVCESFYKEGGEQRVAEMFVQMGERWHQQSKTPGALDHFFQPGGKRLVVDDKQLGAALRAFYGNAKKGRANVSSVEAEEENRLSFVGGIYARCFHDGVFYGEPTDAMRNTISILRAEGCELSEVVLHNGVPTILSFKVKPSDRVAKLFALVDRWQPPALQWKEK